MTDHDYEELKAKLVQTVKKFAQDKDGITFYDLAGLLGEGQVYSALAKEAATFVSPRQAQEPGR